MMARNVEGLTKSMTLERPPTAQRFFKINTTPSSMYSHILPLPRPKKGLLSA
jgi:hypothetical protein